MNASVSVGEDGSELCGDKCVGDCSDSDVCSVGEVGNNSEVGNDGEDSGDGANVGMDCIGKETMSGGACPDDDALV